jgi:glutamyl-tRNA reductase
MVPTAGPDHRRHMLTIGASHITATTARLGDFGRAAQAFRADVHDGVHGPSGVPVHELAVLATCACVEVYAVTEDSAAEDAAQILDRCVFGGGAESESNGTPYRLRGPDAVRHVCRVASGIESFVVGEHKIAGQVKRAFQDVIRARSDTNMLEGVAAVARRAGRRVRSETGIGRYPASVSSVAVDLAREHLGDLADSRALVVGAGKAALLVARALRSAGVASLTIVNRSLRRAVEVAAEDGGKAAELERLPALLGGADVVVTATGAEDVVLDVTTVAKAVRRCGPDGRPLLVLDLAVPGDVDPGVGELTGVELLTLEDVKSRVHRHISFRRAELHAAERVVDEVVDEFVSRHDAPDPDALIGELRRSVETIRSAEVERWFDVRRSGSLPSRAELYRLTRSVVNKLLHDPPKRLRTTP